VVADTHCPEFLAELPDRLLEGLAGVDLIIHCGDVGGPGGEATLAALARLAPVKAVRGDHDRALGGLPPSLLLNWGGIRIAVAHGNRTRLIEEPVTLIGSLTLGLLWPRPASAPWLRARFPGADLIVYGHTHRAAIERRGAQVVLNPGAVYVVTAEAAHARLQRHPNWFERAWLQVIRHRRDRPRASFALVEVSPGGIECQIVGLD